MKKTISHHSTCSPATATQLGSLERLAEHTEYVPQCSRISADCGILRGCQLLSIRQDWMDDLLRYHGHHCHWDCPALYGISTTSQSQGGNSSSAYSSTSCRKARTGQRRDHFASEDLCISDGQISASCQNGGKEYTTCKLCMRQHEQDRAAIIEHRLQHGAGSSTRSASAH